MTGRIRKEDFGIDSQRRGVDSPDSREQIMSELARLEHEKARIDREISVWVGNQKKAQIRAMEVYDRIAILQGLIKELAPRSSNGLGDEKEESKSSEFREVKFEY